MRYKVGYYLRKESIEIIDNMTYKDQKPFWHGKDNKRDLVRDVEFNPGYCNLNENELFGLLKTYAR